MGSKGAIPPKWFEGDFWKRPPPRLSGDALVEPIYQAVGEALTAWENAEEALAKLYLVLSDIDGATNKISGAVARTYGSIESNTGRRAAIASVAEIFFSPHFEEDFVQRPFQELISNIQAAAKRRDDIAHGRAENVTVVDNDKHKHYGYFLFPVEYNNSRTSAYVRIDVPDGEDIFPFNPMRGHYRYTSQDISAFAFKFSKLRNAIIEFIFMLQKNGRNIKLVTEGLDIRAKALEERAQKGKERKERHQQQQKP